ncbi:MAG: hypothetical protein L3J23_03955 [Flavobacteriaceae bacterium]|nr:hypothetical protein [Flavobacteriaceae bacterium]
MKINYWLLFLFFYGTIYTQQITKTQWKKDLDILQTELLEKEYIFHTFSKKALKIQIDQLKTKILYLNYTEIQWELNKLLTRFKTLNLGVSVINNKSFPFEVKEFNNKYYLTKINEENHYLLGKELIKINEFNFKLISTKMKTVFYLPHSNLVTKNLEKNIHNKSLLNYLDIIKKDTIKLTFNTYNTDLEIINLPFITDLDRDLLVEITPNKTAFNQQKNYVWFWKYGINFGKQMFFKYQVSSSKEHIQKMKDSLQMSSLDYARTYKIPLQEVYDAPTFNPFIEEIIEKLKNPRYKKLIIDLRNHTKGSFLNAKELIKKIAQVKRINKSSRLFILTNKITNQAAIATILGFKEQTKAKIVGETVFGTKEDSDKNNSFTLPNSNLVINYPIHFQEEILITPNILVEPTFNQYLKGIDGLLQKVLDD